MHIEKLERKFSENQISMLVLGNFFQLLTDVVIGEAFKLLSEVFILNSLIL